MLIGLNNVESIDKAFESEASNFITKPLDWTLLTQRVRYVLRTREMSFDLRRTQPRLSQVQRIAMDGIDGCICTLQQLKDKGINALSSAAQD